MPRIERDIAQLKAEVAQRPLPRHVGIIMDGNGRWAEQRGLPRLEGHRRGSDSVREVTRAARRLGARRETTAVARRMPAAPTAPPSIAAGATEDRLWTEGLPPLELVVRTSGEFRVSNFLLWQLAYAEIHFTETLWPDFGELDLLLAIEDFQKRERRFGKTSAQIRTA